MVLNKTEAEFLHKNAVGWCMLIPAIAVENILCLFAVSSRKRWKCPDVLLFSFILAQFITLMVPLFMYTIIILLNEIWTAKTCKFLVWCVMGLRIVNSLQIAYLAMDRVWALKWSSSYRIHNTAKQSARTVMFIWIFSLAIGTIPQLGWPHTGDNFESCSLILNVAGDGFAMCIIVIILGSFLISFICIGTIIFNVYFNHDILDAHLAPDITQQIPEIVIENETGEKTTHVPIQRERQNQQICMLVAVVIITFYVVGDLPFVIVNIMALVTPTKVMMPVVIMWSSILRYFFIPFCLIVNIMALVSPTKVMMPVVIMWSSILRYFFIPFCLIVNIMALVTPNKVMMPVVIMWSSMLTIFLHPILFGILSFRYKRGYYQIFIGVGIGFGCFESEEKENAVLQKQDTIDSLDMFENDDDEDRICYPVPDPAGFGFSASMELDDPPMYEITPPIEGTRTNSTVVVKYQQDKMMKRRANGLEFDNIGFKEEDEEDCDQNNEEKRTQQYKMSTKERRAKFQALKTARNEQRKANDKLNPEQARQSDNHPRNRHRKVERLSSKSVDNSKNSRGNNKSNSGKNNIHTIQAEVENEDFANSIPNVIVDTTGSNSILNSNSTLSDNSNMQPSQKSIKSDRTNSQQENALRNIRYDSIREKVLQEMSSFGSSELYDIPEDPAEDSFDIPNGGYNHTFDGSFASETEIQISGNSLKLEELDVNKLKQTDSQETVPIGGVEDNDSIKRLSFQFSMSGSEGKSDNDSDYSFPAVGIGSIDYGKDPAPDTADSGRGFSFGSNFSDSVSSKSSAKEMRELFKNSKTGRSLVNTLQAQNIQHDVVYL